MWSRKSPLFLPILTAAGLSLLLHPPTLACNPEFPTPILGATDDKLLAAPPGDFYAEVARLAPGASAIKALVPEEKSDPVASADQTDAADLAELKAALAAARTPAKAQQDLLDRYTAWRTAARKGGLPPVPAGLPPEFDHYARGAAFYHARDFPSARAQWEKLLTLAPADRRHRTVWALYMLGRTYCDADPARAADLFAQVRAAAQSGFTDALGLAAASLGWEAQAHWKRGNIERAVALYLEQRAAGDPRAAWSLRDLAADLLKGDEPRLARAAADLNTRGIVTAYLVSVAAASYETRVEPDKLPATAARWLRLVSRQKPLALRGADRLAWVAYRAGDMKDADAWLSASPNDGENTPLGQWIRAKLLLRAGNLDKAAAALAKAAAGFPKNEEWNDAAEGYYGDIPWRPADHAAGELALLKLSRGGGAQLVDALDLLYRHGFWQDAAYLAERVLTPDELKTYVDKHWPASARDPRAKDAEKEGFTDRAKRQPDVRTLLARRLTRLGRWKEARPYFPADLQPILDQYITAIREGHDTRRSAPDRADRLWAAAKLARSRGIDLLATETGPDWAYVDGAFDLGNPAADRLASATQPAHALAPVSKDEQRRLANGDPLPQKRWHYRYIALDHAWDAAELTPDNTDLLATRLIEAGSWVKAQDPRAADRFYKALVTRCPATALGQQAKTLRWFPPTPATP
jgi:hypothetical protein